MTAEATGSSEYEVVAAREDGLTRYELRRYEDRWQAVYLRRSISDGWYVRNQVTVRADA